MDESTKNHHVSMIFGDEIVVEVNANVIAIANLLPDVNISDINSVVSLKQCKMT